MPHDAERDAADTAASAAAEVQRLTARVHALEGEVRSLDDQLRELENETAQRGVKLNCARIALSRAKIAFDETTRHREEMVQDVAHDLRTPLTSIKGAAENLLDGIAGPLAPDAQEYVEIVREHANRLIGAVNWLVDAMRATAEPLEVVGEEIDAAELVRSAVLSLQPIARDRGLTLTVDARSPALVYLDGGKVRQVLENLIGNALKFTEAGGSVHVDLTSSSTDALISVRDTGIGMSPEELERIFDRYYRRPGTPQSSGLGLVIAREIVRLHGGEIRVTSEPGRGSEFTVRLPRDGEALRAWATECA